MPAITTRSEHTGHCIKMHRSLAQFCQPAASNHTLYLVDCITIMFGFRFSVHTGDRHRGAAMNKNFTGLVAHCRRLRGRICPGGYERKPKETDRPWRASPSACPPSFRLPFSHERLVGRSYHRRHGSRLNLLACASHPRGSPGPRSSRSNWTSCRLDMAHQPKS